jgi:hypothetical protein
MDPKKLAKIIKVIVSAEVKRQLPVLVEQEVKKKTKPLLMEIKRLKENQSESKEVIKEDEDMFSMADKVLNEARKGTEEHTPQLSMVDEEEKTFSKNSMIDKILKETKPFTHAQRTAGPVGFEEKYKQVVPLNEASGKDEDFEEWPTMEHNMSATPSPSTTVPEDVRAQMAAKMGYGDMGTGPKKTGLGVKTGLPGLDRVLNRDNSELVKKFKTR